MIADHSDHSDDDDGEDKESMISDSSDDYEDKEESNILNKMTYNDDIDMLREMKAQTLEALNGFGDPRLN